ncbi:MAG: DNA gyrase inhibitor YacG [Yoonia sp.]|uniref:DNA gyrase inhibitor YacG n=1 Tax=Yoonia sp. TaxID=2212373 RepID=UPI003EF1F6AB
MACPICEKPTETAFRPFCSKRCADIDLSKWFSGSYAIPADQPEDAEELDQALRAAEEKKPH